MSTTAPVASPRRADRPTAATRRCQTDPRPRGIFQPPRLGRDFGPLPAPGAVAPADRNPAGPRRDGGLVSRQPLALAAVFLKILRHPHLARSRAAARPRT